MPKARWQWCILILFIFPFQNTDAFVDHYIETNGNNFLPLLLGSTVNIASSSRKRPINFEQVALSSEFVDKTHLIEYFVSQRKHLVILAPRQFGKTFNIQMLQKFFSLQADRSAQICNASFESSVFKRMAVCHNVTFCNTHYASYPVIYIDFRELDVLSEAGFYNSFRKMVHNLYIRHDYLKASKELDPEDFDQFNDYRHPQPPMRDAHVAYGPYVLSRLLATHFNRSCMVFVDNFDYPATELMQELDDKFKASVLRALTYLVKDLIRKNPFVTHSLFSAVDYLALRDLPELVYVPVLEDKVVGRFYGFLEREVKELLGRYNATDLMDSMKKNKKYDGGYEVKGGERVYRSFSVVKFLELSGRNVEKKTTKNGA